MFNRNSYISIQENAFEKIICKMTAILSELQWVKDHSKFMLSILLYFNAVLTMMFHTWYDSCVVMASAEICNYQMEMVYHKTCFCLI